MQLAERYTEDAEEEGGEEEARRCCLVINPRRGGRRGGRHAPWQAHVPPGACRCYLVITPFQEDAEVKIIKKVTPKAAGKAKAGGKAKAKK